jgi:hypothetical protein
MSDSSERTRLANVWYNLTVHERWNGPILIALFAVLIAGGLYFVSIS